MLLYHYTAKEYLPLILAEGLTRGDVPTSPTEGMNAVWLTSDSAADGHGLTDGRELTDREKQMAGIAPTQSARFPNKRAIRLQVRIPQGDRNLMVWSKWARKRLNPDWYRILDEAGGGKSQSWYLYWGTVPPAWIAGIRFLALGEVAA